MWAENDEYLEEAADSLYIANADEIVRQQCRAREDAERRERTLERDNRILKEQYAKAQADNAALQETNATLQKRLKEVEELLSQKNNE